jgi:hypothetical protein
MFAIIEERVEETRTHRNWVARSGPGTTSMMACHDGFPPASHYTDRANAERDAEWFRAENARSIEATKRSRKYKTLPATYTVTELEKVRVGGYAVDEQASYAALKYAT